MIQSVRRCKHVAVLIAGRQTGRQADRQAGSGTHISFGVIQCVCVHPTHRRVGPNDAKLPLLRQQELLEAPQLLARELARQRRVALEVEGVLAHHHPRGHAALGLLQLLAEPALGIR